MLIIVFYLWSLLHMYTIFACKLFWILVLSCLPHLDCVSTCSFGLKECFLKSGFDLTSGQVSMFQDQYNKQHCMEFLHIWTCETAHVRLAIRWFFEHYWLNFSWLGNAGLNRPGILGWVEIARIWLKPIRKHYNNCWRLLVIITSHTCAIFTRIIAFWFRAGFSLKRRIPWWHLDEISRLLHLKVCCHVPWFPMSRDCQCWNLHVRIYFLLNLFVTYDDFGCYIHQHIVCLYMKAEKHKTCAEMHITPACI